MRITTYPLGELQANTYLLTADSSCVIIDPADDAAFLLEEVSRRNLTIEAMIATHGHFDHVMAVGEIQLATGAPFYIREEDMFLVKRVGETARHFLGYEPVVIPPAKTSFLAEGDSGIGGFPFTVIRTPGHTPGGVCLYLMDEECLFSGDTLFKNAVGRTDLSYSNKAELRDSITSLLRLPEETIIYPGHGEPTTILAEKNGRNPVQERGE